MSMDYPKGGCQRLGTKGSLAGAVWTFTPSDRDTRVVVERRETDGRSSVSAPRACHPRKWKLDGNYTNFFGHSLRFFRTLLVVENQQYIYIFFDPKSLKEYILLYVYIYFFNQQV